MAYVPFELFWLGLVLIFGSHTESILPTLLLLHNSPLDTIHHKTIMHIDIFCAKTNMSFIAHEYFPHVVHIHCDRLGDVDAHKSQ